MWLGFGKHADQKYDQKIKVPYNYALTVENISVFVALTLSNSKFNKTNFFLLTEMQGLRGRQADLSLKFTEQLAKHINSLYNIAGNSGNS